MSTIARVQSPDASEVPSLKCRHPNASEVPPLKASDASLKFTISPFLQSLFPSFYRASLLRPVQPQCERLQQPVLTEAETIEGARKQAQQERKKAVFFLLCPSILAFFTSEKNVFFSPTPRAALHRILQLEIIESYRNIMPEHHNF